MKKNMRKVGVLLHISSLAGKYGIGSLGKEAFHFAKLLAKSGIKYWQILPLVQTGFGNSPYQSVSSTSGNPYFIDLDILAKEKLLTKEELKGAIRKGDVDYGDLYENRYPLLRKAFSRFNFDGKEFRNWVKSGVSEDYALFMTAKSIFGGSFCDWDEPLKRRDPEALENLRTEYHEEYLFWNFLQYEFTKQWKNLKRYCHKLGVQIIGDIPLYVAYDSADVWAHPELFKLDKELKPTKVAGVPPDYFCELGQLWGNPVYDWAANEQEGFTWWTNRINSALDIYDVIRIDHFRGIDRYYEIPADAENAIGGEWVDGPKSKFFENIKKRNKIIAEDLGCIDDGVRDLLKETQFPGMKVLLFAFDGNEYNDYLPKYYNENCVVYTGTHDNDTVKGYVDSLSTEQFILLRSRVSSALEEGGIDMNLGVKGEKIPEAFIRLALASKAKLAVVPVQDILSFDNETRMNTPGTNGANWQFRLKKLPKGNAFKRYKKLIKLYRR